MFEVSLDLAAMLIGAAFLAGFVDSIAGGGGLITLPALMLAGANPVQALSTNKVQGAFGAASAAWSYARAGHVRVGDQLGPAALAFGASALGAMLVSFLPTDLLRLGLPVLLIGIALFFALKPGLTDADRIARIGPALFAATVVPLNAGSRDGEFLAGVGGAHTRRGWLRQICPSFS